MTEDRIAELTSALRDLSWTLRRSTPDRAGIPSVPTSELSVLKAVMAAPGATVTEIAERLGLQRPNASAVVRSLELRGLVSRTADTADGRRSLLHATELAHAEAAAIGRAWADVVAEAIGRMPAADRAALLAATSALEALEAAIRA